jgi:hypothetical protein
MCSDLIYRVEVVPGGGGLTDGPGAQVQDVVTVLSDPRVELHYPTLRPVTHTSTEQDHRDMYHQCKKLNAGTVPRRGSSSKVEGGGGVGGDCSLKGSTQ